MSGITRRPEIADHQTVDLSGARRVLVFGDVHGNLALLRTQLAEMGYDPRSGDVAISVGDWLDRGPDALAVRDFLAGHQEIRWVRGNHEDILSNACHAGGRFSCDQAAAMLIRNGGDWVLDHLHETENRPDDNVVEFADMLNSAPVAMTVLTPGGHRVGIVHAAVPADSWTDLVDALEGPDPHREEMAFHAMWDRAAADYAIRAAKDGQQQNDLIVPGIDHVFYGHTRTGKRPVRHGNQTWLDTGAYSTGILTMVDIDQWIATASSHY